MAKKGLENIKLCTTHIIIIIFLAFLKDFKILYLKLEKKEFVKYSKIVKLI